ncbi:tetratricopeptide repeat protein [Lusitaniella coriacea]|uniref:tetratricopeptide repeat protein n=1 Tax=Lusitaniella coriacea TaxID=1983105 RepID=UPI003CEA9529
MLEKIADAIKLKDYKTAVRLLKPFLKSEPNNPWAKYYAARIYEETGKLESAQKLYRQVLPKTTSPQLIAKIRQGIARLQGIEENKRQQAISKAQTQPGGTESGVLIVEAISAELKKSAAQQFAKIMGIDPYLARLQLPSRGWRLYRTGSLGELQYYVSTLRQAEISSFCGSLVQLEDVEVFEVQYFLSVEGEAIARCQNQSGQIGTMAFNWSELTQIVRGRVPLFASVVVVDAKHQLQRKTQTQDYANICDLHLPSRNCILRLCDRNYNFKEGMVLAQNSDRLFSRQQETTRRSWQNLMTFIDNKFDRLSVWSDFTPFAETAFGFGEMLDRLDPCLNLKRRDKTPWDAAFQLYSGLVLLRSRDRASI